MYTIADRIVDISFVLRYLDNGIHSIMNRKSVGVDFSSMVEGAPAVMLRIQYKGGQRQRAVMTHVGP